MEMAPELNLRDKKSWRKMFKSEECPVERCFRDAYSFTFLDSATQIQKLIISREILGMSAFV